MKWPVELTGTDDEYVEALKKLKVVVDRPDFSPYPGGKVWEPGMIIGDRDSNCGLCNRNVWPKNHPYRQEHHRCHLDRLPQPEESTFIGHDSGCQWRCLLFHVGSNAPPTRPTVDEIRELLDGQLEDAERVIREHRWMEGVSGLDDIPTGAVFDWGRDHG